ncbi:MAG: hypothetical protein RIC30_05645 [Marinoscillum sp.]|uniref:CBU_0592 family membrane protein n=1 Tax=Marinoscillum sp. TaxID=2024838 RepID=UPI0032F15E33
MNTTDWLGSVGVFLILLAYLLNTLGTLTTKDLAFILLNLTGAALACLASILLDYLPFIILEGAWTVVSCFSLVKYLRNSVH